MHIPHSRPNFGQAFEKAAQSVVHSGFLAQGKEVAALEKAIQNNLNNQHVIAVDSGTSALTLAIRALTQHKPNARVGIPAYACASLLFAVKASGALPIFMDCNTSLCLDREPALHIAKTLDILILVHPFGMVEPLVTETFSCPVIEDIAQSAGATLHGKPVGTFTGMSIGSLYATKPWGGAYGGFISSTHTNLIEDIRAMSDPDDANLKAAYVGHHQLSNLHASIALVKQKIYTQEAAQRQHWSNLYDIALQDLNVAPIHAKQSNHFRYIIRCPHGASQIITQFQALGIAAMHPVQTPLHHAKATHACSHADSAWKHCVSIPLLADMSEGEFAYLQQGLKTCLTS